MKDWIIWLLAMLFFSTHSLAASLTADEKRNFVQWFFNLDCYSDERAQLIASGKIDRFKVSLISFDIDGDGQEEIISINPFYRDRSSDFPIVFSFANGAWRQYSVPGNCFMRLSGLSIVEFSGNRKSLARLGMKTGESYFKSFVSDMIRVSRSSIPGAPQEPSITESQIDRWLSASDPSDSVAEGLPIETCIGVTDNGGGGVQFRCFYEMISFSLFGIDENGMPVNHVFPGGGRDMIANPDFRSWIRSIPIEVFSGTNAVPVRPSEVRYPQPNACRTNIEANCLSKESRDLLSETLLREGISPERVWLVIADIDSNGVADAFVSTNGIGTANHPVEWHSWLYSNEKWMPIHGRISPQKRIFRNGFYDSVVVPPSIPPIISAGPNDFYRIWHAANGSFINVFQVTGPNPWDVSSPLSEADTPKEMKRIRFLNGYRRTYTDWIELHALCYPSGKILSPCDFFDLFDFSSGTLQLERLMPEKLIPQ